MFHSMIIPDLTMYLVAILGLLVVWQYYQMQVMAGRILAVDIFDRSGIRMYVYVVSGDEHVCDVCAEAHGRVFAPSQVAKNGFTPLDGACQGATPCVGALVGLYGGWLEARGVVDRLRANLRRGGIQLSAQELRAMVNGQWERSISADTDRLAIHMIEALSYEKVNRDVAIADYRFVIDQVKEVRHLMLLVPAYLRLTELLMRAGKMLDAAGVIERFESRFPMSRRGPHFPSNDQREWMRTKMLLALKGIGKAVGA